jgi:hypothetical protein
MGITEEVYKRFSTYFSFVRKRIARNVILISYYVIDDTLRGISFQTLTFGFGNQNRAKVRKNIQVIKEGQGRK